jgi:hypothetical protein
VPEDAAAVVIAGPTRMFLDAELAALKRHVEGGGALFVGIDPRAQTNLYGLLEGFGVRLGDDVVVDRTLAIFGQATTPFGDAYDPEHEITRVLANPSVFPMVRSVELDSAAAARFSILVRTGSESWAERDLDAWRESGRAEYSDNDLLGPVPIAVAGTVPGAVAEGDAAAASDAPAGRLVVFGDSDFASNQYLGTAGNRDPLRERRQLARRRGRVHQPAAQRLAGPRASRCPRSSSASCSTSRCSSCPRRSPWSACSSGGRGAMRSRARSRARRRARR